VADDRFRQICSEVRIKILRGFLAEPEVPLTYDVPLPGSKIRKMDCQKTRRPVTISIGEKL
jgi:hypothetical protein